MIIGQKTEDITKIGDFNSKKATINQNELGKLQYLLTKGLYSDPVGAVIVEWTNNAVDAVVQAGKNPIEHPVIVKIDKNKFSVEDKGIGLTKEDFETICMSYLTSTKSNSNDYIGSFGIGLKSFMSLERGATFIIRKDGKECKYLAYAGAEFMEYDLLYEKDANEENGVICELPINNWDEEQDFIVKAKQRLSYYDTVVLIVNDEVVENKIYRSDDWQFSPNADTNIMHLCLKDVFYTIDWAKLGIVAIHVPVALRFGLDEGLTPTPSRENLIFNEHTKKLILSKIKKVADYFVEKYNSEWKEHESFRESWNKIGNSNKIVTIGEESFIINPLINYSKIVPKELKVKGIDIETPEFYKRMGFQFLDEYETLVDYGHKWRKTHVKRNHGVNSVMNNSTHILVESVPKGRVKKFLLEKYGSSDKILFLKKVYERKLGKRGVEFNKREERDYRHLLDLSLYKKNTWRDRIKEWQFVEDQWKSCIIDETRVENTQEYITWLEQYKEEIKRNKKSGTSNYKALNKEQGDITLSYFRKKIRGGSYCEDRGVFKIESLHKNKFLTIYDTVGDYFETYAQMFPKVKFCIVGKREVKRLPQCKNFKTIQQFMSQTTKPFVKVVTARKVDRVLEIYDGIVSNEILENTMDFLKEDIETLRKYSNDNFIYMDDEIAETVYTYAEENNIYDREIMEVVNRVVKKTEDYEFVSLLKTPNSWDQEEIKRYKKFLNRSLLYRKLYKEDALSDYKLVKVKKKKEELVETD